MTLHLVGETIDRSRSHYLAETGRLVQLMRGVYADAGDDIDAIVIAHAVRIAKYLYPNAYLSANSAVLLGPTADGRLFLSGRRVQRTRIRNLEIIQNTAPKHPSLGSALVADSLGEFRVEVSSIRQRFLEAFRLRSEHAASLDAKTRDSLAARLIEEYGSAQAAGDATWALARENEWYREGEGAERLLLRRPPSTPVRNAATLDLTVAWHAAPVGHLVHDGFEWRWLPIATAGPTLIRQTMPGKLPPFIVSLLPEGWLEAVLDDRDERAMLRSGRRYMSNIAIVEDPAELASLPLDLLSTKLKRYEVDGVFTGLYQGPRRGTLEQSFEDNLARIYDRADTPRLSGVQIKAPMHLGADGTLAPSTETSFTHILKPAGTSGFQSLPVVEWTALSLGRSIGFDVPAAALVAMPDDMPPALLVERFDIRNDEEDHRLIALEDFCSVMNLSSDAKYDATIEQVARSLRALSTMPDDDVRLVYKRALFAWLIADGDMHLKNLALVKTAEPNDDRFHTVRLAPLYDAATTRVFPRLERDRMALKLNGKDERLRRADFKVLARTIGLRAVEAEATVDETMHRLTAALDAVKLPSLHGYGTDGEAMFNRMLELCRARVESFK